MAGPSAPNDIRFETSTTTLPATASPISAAMSAALLNGTARTTTDDAFDGGFVRLGDGRAGLRGDGADILGIARGDGDGVSGANECGGERAADVAGPDDGDVHDLDPPMWLDELALINQTWL